LNVLYQTRAVCPKTWETKLWVFRKRLCRLVGSEWTGKRPTTQNYLGLLDAIKRTTLNNTIRGILEDYFAKKGGKDAQARGVTNFGSKDPNLHKM